MKTIYLCGPTLYSDIHIGNARSLVLFDVIAEYHRRNGGVKYARNITDFDDKIFALCGGESPAKWVKENTLPSFRLAEKSLGLKPPDVEPFASDYVPDMISMIEVMHKHGSLIELPDGLYFDPRGTGYGSLSNRDTQKPFAVWKKVKGHEFGWPSSFGKGRPGWHTECAAMIQTIFGGHVDLHGGGNDLKFPHHENENAQCYCVNNRPIAKEWLHVGSVNMEGRKMAKSTGNVALVKDLAKDFCVGAIRTALLMKKHSKPIEFSLERLKEAEKLFNKNNATAFLTDQPWSDRQLAMLSNNYMARF